MMASEAAALLVSAFEGRESTHEHASNGLLENALWSTDVIVSYAVLAF